MTRDKEHQIDQTFLSLAQATKRGFLHRDYVAHCLRWTHVLKVLNVSRPARILELGCGVEAPLAKTLYSSRHTMHQYLGVDYGPIESEVEFKGKFQPQWLPNKDISRLTVDEVDKALGGKADVVISFEVAEHMQPDRWIRALKRAMDASESDAVFLFSTPCFDERVGAAANHINEWRYETLLYTFEAMGLLLVDNWGTFASQRDYKENIRDEFGDGGVAMFETFAAYFDTNMLSCVMAPLFPTESRNVLWQLKKNPAGRWAERLTEKVAASTRPLDLGQCDDVASWARFVDLLKIPRPAWMV